MTQESPPQHSDAHPSVFPDLSSQIVLLSQSISELTVAVSTLNHRISSVPPAPPSHLVPAALASVEAELGPTATESTVISMNDSTTEITREPYGESNPTGESTAIPAVESTAIPADESTAIPAGEIAFLTGPAPPTTHMCARASMRAAVHAALSTARPFAAPTATLPTPTVPSATSITPPTVPPIPVVAPLAMSTDGQAAAPAASSVPPPYDSPVDASMGRHWYLVTKGLQTGVFLSWETTSPLVTGVSRAVYYRVPNAATGWIRYGNALREGNVEIIMT